MKKLSFVILFFMVSINLSLAVEKTDTQYDSFTVLSYDYRGKKICKKKSIKYCYRKKNKKYYRSYRG